MQQKIITILDLRDSPWVDGPGRTILDCAESLNERGFQFIIGSFSGGEQKTSEYVDEAKRRGLKFALIHEKKSFDRDIFKQIKNIIAENNVDVIHCHDFRSNIFGLICGRICDVTVITTVHGWINNNIKGTIYTYIDKFLLRFFDHIITVSYKTKSLVRKVFIPDEKVSVINNALKIENYLEGNVESYLRQELDIDSDTILIGCIGRLSQEKGQLEFLRACKDIINENIKVKLVLVGMGPDKDKLNNYVELNGMSESVFFTGFRKDMNNIYNNLDLVVQSSFTEGMPNVILEALLMSTPVIATDVGGTSEIIENGINGVLINPGKENEIHNCIKNFLKNREQYLNMAKVGKIKIIKEFNHDSRIKKLINIYANSIKEKE